MGSGRSGYRGYYNYGFRINLLISVFVLLMYYCNIYVIQELWPESLYVKNHLNDTLGGVLIVSFMNMLASLGRVWKLYLTRMHYILALTFVCGVYWELIAPLYVPNSTSDIYDLGAYMLGGLIYFICIKCIAIFNGTQRIH